MITKFAAWRLSRRWYVTNAARALIMASMYKAGRCQCFTEAVQHPETHEHFQKCPTGGVTVHYGVFE